ncbi:hypothetical protein BGX28_009279 [Mortierella sp. GBA30]|nr:hypothetical protein BGX28_009279 [Mortierella sp. GBA30]
MAYQYTFPQQPQPQPQAGSLLDSQNNPTRLLMSFSSAVFDWVDNSHAPKGSGILEPEKMDVILALTAPKLRSFGYLDVNIVYQAFSVETVFTASGPAVTRAGFLTYLRSEMMVDPDDALRSFNAIVTASRIGPLFARSQFLPVRDPGATKTCENIQAYFPKLLQGIQAGLAKIVQQDEAQLKQQERKINLLNMATQQADAQFARNAAASERMGWIGTGVCYGCGKHRCRCGSYDTNDLMGSI